MLDIVVDFFVPGVPVAQREKVGRAYARAYEVLYDEDVQMMTERQQQLDKRIEGVRSGDSLELGPVDEITTPLSVSLSQRGFVLDRAAGEWVVYPERCPHQLGRWNCQTTATRKCVVLGMVIGLICKQAIV